MCDDQEQRPFYFGWWQTCIIYRQLEDALQADEQVNKDRLVALGIDWDSTPIEEEKIHWKDKDTSRQSRDKNTKGKRGPDDAGKNEPRVLRSVPGFPPY